MLRRLCIHFLKIPIALYHHQNKHLPNERVEPPKRVIVTLAIGRGGGMFSTNFMCSRYLGSY